MTTPKREEKPFNDVFNPPPEGNCPCDCHYNDIPFHCGKCKYVTKTNQPSKAECKCKDLQTTHYHEFGCHLYPQGGTTLISKKIEKEKEIIAWCKAEIKEYQKLIKLIEKHDQ